MRFSKQEALQYAKRGSPGLTNPSWLPPLERLRGRGGGAVECILQSTISMKTLPCLFVSAAALLIVSCAETYEAGEFSRRSEGPILVERQPVVVEQRRYVETPQPVTVERYSRSYVEPGTRTYSEPAPQSYGESRPYYGDPAPSTTYQRRTTTRTYQGY